MSLKNKGFTLIEVLVAIVLLSTVILITTGFLLPLQLTRDSTVETTALTYGRSYLELVKIRWSNASGYNAPTANLPTFSVNSSSADIKMATGWDLANNSSTWAVTDNIRTVTVILKPPKKSGEAATTWQGRWVELSALITRP